MVLRVPVPGLSLALLRVRRETAALLALLVLTFTSGCVDGPVAPSTVTDAMPSAAVLQERPATGHEPGRVLVSFRPGADGSALAGTLGATLSREFIPGAWIASVPEGSERSVAQALSQNPNVIFAEPDYRRVFDDPLCTGCALPSDGLFEWQWNLHNDGDVDLGFGLVMPTNAVDSDIDWLEAFQVLGPAPQGAVRIGVLDTGIRATHTDFCGKAVTWKDFYENPSSVPFDPHGHGTHVSGIAGACADNGGNGGAGVAGIAYGPNMEFVVGKVCAVDGTCLASAISEAIYWAVDQGANVLNMSFGDTAQSSAEAQALQYAAQNNVLPVCAAGNDGVRSVLFPAADPNCVAVSATDNGDDRASYSSYGPQVELSAPGGDIEDVLFGTSMIVSTWSGSDGDYLQTMGTSMAAPHVTGLAAVLYALGVTNAADIRACLRNTADDLGSAGWDEDFGWGRINMYQAVLQAGSCATGGGGGDPSGNVAPTAVLSHSCTANSCSFDGTESWDADGQVVAYAWDFGDGASATGPTASHTYGSPGLYLVRLTVTDDDGAVGTSSAELTIGFIHVSDLEAWSEWGRGSRWQAYLAVTVTDAGGSPVSGATVQASWSGATTGSGTSVTDASGVATLATGNIRGDGPVTFTVTSVSHPAMSYDPARDGDADGDSDGRTITIGPPNELPQAGFVESCDALVCTFTDASTDADGSIVSWSWDFGDGGTSTEQSPTHTYALSLFYLVTLTVTDDQGATSTESRLVFVPPVDGGLVLTGSVSKDKGSKQIDLQWTGGSGDVVDLYREGVIIEYALDARSYTDVIGRASGSYTYRVCETFTNVCSNDLTIDY